MESSHATAHGQLPEAHNVQESRQIIHSLKMRADENRSLAEKMADVATRAFGSMTFLIANVLFFAAWLVINTGILPGVEPFDPFPFGLLTTIVSLEAIILAIFVLISQNRAEKVADLRQEVDLQVDRIAEQELTKLLHMVSMLLEKHGIDVSDDDDLQAMLGPTNVEELEQALTEQVVKKSP